MAVVAAMVSCSENLENTPTNPETDKLPINISTTLTRATDSAFEAGDKVGIFVVNEPNALEASGNYVDNMGFTYSTTWTPDTPIYWLDETTKADFYCYYPYAEGVSTTAHTFATKANQSQLADYKASEFLWGKVSGVAPTEKAVNITTTHTFSNALVILKPGDGFTEESLAAATKSVKICGIKTNATINLATGVANATGNATEVTPYLENGQYRALIVPQTTAEGALIVVTVDGVDYTLTRSMTFNANKQHKFTVTLNKVNNGVNVGIGGWETDEEDYGGDGGIDLSLYTDLSVEGTANCYLVQTAGKYKFKAVKGNSDATVGNVKKTEVLWESFGTDVAPNVGDIVTGVGYKNGYVYFSTPEVFGNGNASIAVRNSKDIILWSWHIWCSEDGWNDHVYANNAGTMMDRNLGATSAIPGDIGAFGLLYQWGRKDPFMGACTNSGTTLAASTGSWKVASSSYEMEMDFAEENPMTFATEWEGGSVPGNGWHTSESAKGLYDPCPVGYRVPDGGENGFWATAYVKATGDYFNGGMYWTLADGETTAWYPAVGHRRYDSGSLNYVGVHGWCRSASPSPSSTNIAYNLNFLSGGDVYPAQQDFRGDGCSVRCVRESY